MSFLQLVRREMHGSLRKLVFMSAIGGVSNSAILAAINAGAQSADTSHKAESVGGHAVRDFAVSVHQDPDLRHYHDHRRDRGHHSPAARAPHGSCAALGAAGGRSDRARADRSPPLPATPR